MVSNSLLKFSPIKIGIAIMAGGIITTAVSIDYSNSIAALVGLTLILWGGIIIYIRPRRYLRMDIVKNIFLDMTENLESCLNQIQYTNNPVYFTDASFEGIREVKIKSNGNKTNDDDIILVPPGLSLHKIIERELNINFTTVEKKALFKKLEKVLTEELDLAKVVNIIQLDENTFKTNIEKNIFMQNNHFDKWLKLKIGDPLTSAIACILTRSTGNEVIIKEVKKNTEDKVEVYYKTLTT